MARGKKVHKSSQVGKGTKQPAIPLQEFTKRAQKVHYDEHGVWTKGLWRDCNLEPCTSAQAEYDKTYVTQGRG